MRVSHVVVASSPFALMLAAADPAIAQEDCLPALKQDVVNLDRASIVSLSVLDQRLEDASNEEKTGVFATYGEYSLDFDQSESLKQKLETLLDIDYTNAEKELLRSTTLSRNAVDAYLSCLSSREGIEIPASISAGAVNSDSFFLTFKWNKKDRPEKADETATLMITQGVFRDTNSFNMEVPVQDRETTTVRVVRNRFEPSEISIEIPGTDPTLITVPKVPSVKLVSTPTTGDSFGYTTSQSTGTFGRDLCVYAPAGSIVVPNSFRLHYVNKILIGVTASEGPLVQDLSKACRNFQGAWQTQFGSGANVSVQAIAEVLTPVTIPEALQAAPQPVPTPASESTATAGN